jgi:uncharacterized Zn finger protein/superfamily II DNA or RNA helicase
MARNFGKTWWGQQWLNSLSNIDYSNRLPRGSSYAGKGAVASIDISGSRISAKVKGSQPRPYSITIAVPEFSAGDIRKLIDALSRKPVIISKLLNRELDPEVLAISTQQGLQVFPRQWKDFGMECSCPDWAVPCKHLAAVIYKMSAEIDNNPFLVFELHGVDLTEELKRTGILIEQNDAGSIPLLEDLLLAGPPKTAKSKKPDGDHAGNPFKALHFSTLTPIHDALVQLAEDAPVFYQNAGNFREKYAAGIHKAVRNMQRIIKGKAGADEFFARAGGVSQPLTRHSTMSAGINGQGKASFTVDRRTVSASEAICLLAAIPADRIDDCAPGVTALRYGLLTAYNLLASGAAVPQIVRLSAKGAHATAIRWLPAMLSKETRDIVERYQSGLPAGLLFLADIERREIVCGAGVHLISIFLTELVSRLSGTPEGDVFLDLFFNRAACKFDKPGEQALPGGIEKWLQRYYLAQGDFRPAIVVEERSCDRFALAVTLRESARPQAKPVQLRDVFAQKKYDARRFAILQSVSRLSPFVPGLDACINSRGADSIELTIREFTPFLMQAVPVIRLMDIDLLLPVSLREILRPRPSLRVKQKAKDAHGFLRLDKLLDFDWQVAIGDELISEEDFRRMLKHSEGLLKYRTGYIYVTPDELQKLYKHFTSTRELSPSEILRAVLSGEYRGAAIALTGQVQQLIAQLTDQAEVALPAGLKATLRPYQHRGFSWIVRNTQIGFGSVIADDMGLGKTLQVIATILKYKEEGLMEKEKALVVVPTGLLTNWQAEIEKFAPALACKTYHGAGRSIEKGESFDILLTTYGVARSDADKLKKMKWQALVVDEAQNIKNSDTAQSKAVKSIPAHTFIAMSGTPVENRLSELWSIMDFCNRGFLGNLKEFKETFAIPIQTQNDTAAAEKLKRVTAPFLMRRLKSDKTIIDDLPEKIEMDAYCTLTGQQTALYEKTLHEAMREIEGIDGTGHKALFARQGLVLQMILALKQICNHPTQFLKNKVMDASLSGKMELLFERLEEIVENNEKVLVFTQFAEMGELLKRFIAGRFGEEPLFYHGGCTIKQRKQMVDAFQTNRDDRIFILSLKAAGTGLNLTAASHVIHYDLWWNPAVEAQATDRAYRIGQKKNVVVHRFITKATFEERINEMIQNKKALAEMTVATGENWIGNLGNQELRNIFELK